MKVILINPISELAKSSPRYYRSVTPLPPLGIAYLAGVLKTNGINVQVEDQYATRTNNEELINKIGKEVIDIVGISCLTTAMDNVRQLVNGLKKLKKPPIIIMGNIHPTIFTNKLLKHKEADIIIREEGEQSLLETVVVLSEKGDLSKIKGISYCDKGQIKHNCERLMLEDLDGLPYPAWDLFKLQHYNKYPMLGIYNKLVLPVHASRGCPYKCTYCSQDKIYARPRYRKIINLVDEIEFLYANYGVKYVGFTDAYFPFTHESGIDFCQEMIKRKLHKRIRWFTETRVDKVSLDLLKKMKEANVYLIMYGFESGNQNILNSVNKCTTLRQAEIAMKHTKKCGIVSFGLFMLGLPGENKATCEETIKFAKALDPDIAKFNIATPFPGSKFYDLCKDRIGKIKKFSKFTSWYNWAGRKDDMLYSPVGLTKEELLFLQKKAMFQFFARPGIVLRHILKRTFSLSDLFYGAYIVLIDHVKNCMKAKRL